MLVGNEETGYRYYSKNGANKGSSGASDHDNLGEICFSSVQEFLDSDFNTVGTDSEIKSDRTAGYHYTHAYEIESNTQEDLKAEESFKKSSDNGYSLVGANCADAVCDAVSSIGVQIPKENDKRGKLIDKATIVLIPAIGPSSSNILNYMLNWANENATVPEDIYRNIKRIYPNGVERVPKL